MKHATPASLEKIAALLARLETLPNLKRKDAGAFYLKSKAFLHFHEDPAGLFADVAVDGGWERFPVNTPRGQDRLYRIAGAGLGSIPSNS